MCIRDSNVKFSTYAVPLISGEIKRFLRDDGMIKVSRSLKELAYRAYTCQDKLRKKWGRDPTLLELARALEVEPEELTAALEASSDVESLHKPIYQKDGHEIELMDKLEEKECREEELLNQDVYKRQGSMRGLKAGHCIWKSPIGAWESQM